MEVVLISFARLFGVMTVAAYVADWPAGYDVLLPVFCYCLAIYLAVSMFERSQK